MGILCAEPFRDTPELPVERAQWCVRVGWGRLTITIWRAALRIVHEGGYEFGEQLEAATNGQ